MCWPKSFSNLSGYLKMDIRIGLMLMIFGSMLSRTDAVCAINPCNIGDMCPGKTCVLQDNCMINCECDVTSTADDCSNMTSSPLDTTESTLGWTRNDSECLCIHGNCSTNDSMGCVCDDGWSGDLCDLECLLNCDPGFKCEIIQAPFRFSICSPNVTPTPTTMSPLNETSPIDLDPGLRVYNVCSDDYIPRPMSERLCVDGWLCFKGICQSNGSKHWCECDVGATGQVCQDTCCKSCLHGECFYDMINEEELCNCYMNYSGSFCDIWDPPGTEAATEQPVWHYWVVGSCAFVLLLLICLVIVVPYILWKHRVILVMKVVHYFQEYEDDDDREWDVFISYKSTTSDESFVVETLFPKLEKELGFKVNVHFRDFVAGETISNNIISAVQGSRRTILIISPAYVTSEFTQFEYQVAQQEMLKRKHRIIPILLEDISSCKETMDPMLKVILGSVTYIEWPKVENEKKLDKFWKRIELSMPKKKTRSVDSSTQPALTNGVCKSSKPNTTESTSNKTRFQNGSTDGNIYTVIDESKLNNEEVYDTLNESEMLTQVMKRQSEVEKKSKQDEFLNVLKVDL